MLPMTVSGSRSGPDSILSLKMLSMLLRSMRILEAEEKEKPMDINAERCDPPSLGYFS